MVSFAFVRFTRAIKNCKLVYDRRNKILHGGEQVFERIINIHACQMRYLGIAFFLLHSSSYFSIKEFAIEYYLHTRRCSKRERKKESNFLNRNFFNFDDKKNYKFYIIILHLLMIFIKIGMNHYSIMYYYNFDLNNMLSTILNKQQEWSI